MQICKLQLQKSRTEEKGLCALVDEQELFFVGVVLNSSVVCFSFGSCWELFCFFFVFRLQALVVHHLKNAEKT
jgi:hypothetical protein